MTAEPQFEPFMRQHQDMVFSTALRLVNNAAEAEDIAQEVFLKAYEHFSEIGGSPSVAGWLRRVAINLGLNHLSRYRRRWTFFSEIPREDDQRESVEAALPPRCDLGEELAAAERNREVQQALRKLPDAHRVPLVLFYLEGLTYSEIAQRLRVSVGKVKTDMFRGRAGLRTRLLRECGPAVQPRRTARCHAPTATLLTGCKFAAG